MTNLNFFRGNKQAIILKDDKTDGQFYFAKDTMEIYIQNGDDLLLVSDVITLDTESDRTGILAPLSKFYYVTSTGKFYKYDTDWVCLNSMNESDYYTKNEVDTKLANGLSVKYNKATTSSSGNIVAFGDDETLTDSDISIANVQSVIDSFDSSGKLLSTLVPTASAEYIGGIKVGEGLEISEDGTVEVVTAGEFVTVKSMGCVGDGVTDDTVAFTNAINEAISVGKVLYINPGTYLITDRLKITSSLFVLGGNHDTTIVKFQGTYHEETAYDADYYPESNACFMLIADNIMLQNFTIVGGTSKYDASTSNGVIFHYTKPNGTQYDAAQRCSLIDMDIKYFKNGIFIYAGWNRYFLNCHIIDCTNAGLKWYPLEESTVGAWAASGDVMISSQFIGCGGESADADGEAGISATNAFQTVIWNCVFEYNKQALKVVDCRDIIFKACWNEANYGNSTVKGNCKFEGGYNFGTQTVLHTLSGGSDIVVFESETSTIITSGSETRFVQQGGIITKGVELSAEVDNMIINPYFEEASGGTSTIPSTTGWSFYPNSSICTVSEDVKYNTFNSLHYVVSGQTSDVYFQANATTISVTAGEDYAFSVQCKTPDRSTIDNGLVIFIAWKDGSGTTINLDNRTMTMVGDNNWEEKSIALTAPSSAATCIVGLGCMRNGNVYFANPQFALANALVANNVYVRQSDTEQRVDVFDISGIKLGELEYVDDTEITLTAGDGLTGGGNMSENVSVALGTPSTITSATENAASEGTHTHALTITKADVGLSNVDNTSDTDKPVSTATEDYVTNAISNIDISSNSTILEIMTLLTEMTSAISNKSTIVSVSELPESPDSNTWYAIQEASE